MIFDIALNGMDKLAGAIKAYPAAIKSQMRLAGKDCFAVIVNTKGLATYPPATERNKPGRMKTVTFANGRSAQFRMPYYTRGYGTMTPVRGGGYKLIPSSERFGTKWYTRPSGEMDTIIGNNASYAQYLSGKIKQVEWAAEVGWRKLSDVAMEKMPQIKQIFSRHIDYVTKKIGL